MSASVLPDCEAQKLWDRVAAMSDRISDTVDGIARLTVCGRRTRAELRQAGSLLGRAVALLERTSGRESRAFAARVRSMDEDSSGGNTELFAGDSPSSAPASADGAVMSAPDLQGVLDCVEAERQVLINLLGTVQCIKASAFEQEGLTADIPAALQLVEEQLDQITEALEHPVLRKNARAEGGETQP